ncbi:MSMEG_0569 family flavin-dependent oxidoreductase [Actinomycetospora corticicola]|uniref:Putative flavoprotein involved in K+ transport n=1 Tax=Actinomycetospora corticicola TaxID=663602 RepID=A0A7Y9J8U4_9PSEU|nr:MSMEG_0569 family flavin-dependent oxidoreductase [Actinomycetospora corticicola]NYD39471.1 putative flavoprotein involved in K+ transport [Actinomycetospora corticicola]
MTVTPLPTRGRPDVPGDLTGVHRPVIVIGGGQAGLSMSRCLSKVGVDHLVLERDEVAHSWKTYRWDTFCLVTPNWQCNLPDFPYGEGGFGGTDPHGFMVRSQIVEYLEAYRAFVDPPLLEGVGVNRLFRDDHGTYHLATTAGECTADQVVVATGGYHTPITPPLSQPLPDSVTQVQSQDYRSGAQLPPGEVLVVGSGQSGAQIAEDLHLEGRTVHLVVGDAPRVARFYRGRDVTDWLDEMGYYRMPVTEHPRREAVRAQANHYVTGRDGGRDIDLRAHARDGMRLYGLMTDHRDGVLHFNPDLTERLDHADEVSESIKDTIDKYIADRHLDVPAEERYTPVWQPTETTELRLADTDITSVVWCIGFRQNFSWVDVPVFSGRGAPGHQRGVTSAPGLYFLGLPWQWTWGSGRFSGVGDDARYLAERIRSQRGLTTAGGRGDVCNVLALGS